MARTLRGGFNAQVEILREVTDDDLMAGPMRSYLENCMDRGIILLQRRAPVDSERLYDSLDDQHPESASRVDPAAWPEWCEVGTAITDPGEKWGGYPNILDTRTWPHYRSTEHRGKPTEGWLSDAQEPWERQCDAELANLGSMIINRWLG